MIVFELETDVARAAGVVRRTLGEFTHHGLDDLCLELSTPRAADMAAVLGFLRPDERVQAGGRLRRPDSAPAWDAADELGLSVHRIGRFSELGVSWTAERISASAVFPQLNPVSPGAAVSAQRAHLRDRTSHAGHFGVRLSGPKGAAWEDTSRRVAASFGGASLIEGPRIVDGSRARDFDATAILDGPADVRRADGAIASWTSVDWIEFAWSMEPGRACDAVEAALGELVVGTDAPPDARKTWRLGDRSARRATPNVLPGALEPLLAAMLERRMTGVLWLAPMTWRCPSRPEPYTYWESRLELRILQRGLKLLVDFQVAFAAEKPLLNAVRREYRKALAVPTRGR